ncbi:MAG: thiamine-binding protein [Acidimicrobiales bacterium]
MLAALSVTPLGGGSVDDDGSVGAVVAEVVRIVRSSGLANETNAMFTNVEGTLDEVLDVVRRCVARAAELAPRVSVVVKLDVRPGHDDTLHSKVVRLEQHLTGR